MEFPGAGVCVVDALNAIGFGQQVIELRNVGRQIRNGNGCVFDYFSWASGPGNIVDDSLAGTAEIPHLVALGAKEHRTGVA